jgi:N-acetyl-gamma-glutamyl-phosphate reductase
MAPSPRQAAALGVRARVAIVGAAGYTGGESLRLLLQHPHVQVVCAHSRSQAGKPVHAVHTDLFGDTDLLFTSDLATADAHLLCLGHGEAAPFLQAHALPETSLVVDLSQDHRMPGSAFVYGLPELHRGALRGTTRVANPGCFATAIQLALLPALTHRALQDDVQVCATTGSTGAGQAPNAATHFTWRFGNHSPYKELEHQHGLEIGATVQELWPGFEGALHFIPQRGAFTRGIVATVHTATSWSASQATEAYHAFYAAHPFTHVAHAPVDLHQVVNTNKCLLHVQVKKGRLLVTAVLDNLLKGASGQAVQNLNLALGLDEVAGLRLKASAY